MPPNSITHWGIQQICRIAPDIFCVGSLQHVSEPFHKADFMLTIKPISQLNNDEIKALAIAAAERGEPVATANVFERNSIGHAFFCAEYSKAETELTAAA